MTPQKVLSSLSFLALILICTLTANAAQIVSFSPTGAVKKIQQVTVRFSADMVAMGDPRANQDLFTISCKVPSKKKNADEESAQQTPAFKTRWADSRNWVLEFNQPLKAGIRCNFHLKDELKDLNGEKISGLEEYNFSTAGPALLGVAPIYGGIEPEQYFVALADGPLDLKSVEAKSYFEVEGFPDKVGVKIITGVNREAVIKASLKDNWRWRSHKDLIEQKPLRPFSQIKEMQDFIVIAAQRRFPENAKVVLHWPKGITSTSGLPVEEAQTFEFKVIEPFKVTFSCDRLAPGRPCNPILDMRLNFTRTLSLKSLKGTKIVSSKGQTWLPTEKNNDVDGLTFKGPFPEKETFKVYLPAQVKDEIGRSLTNLKKFPLDVQSDEYTPLLKFSGHFGVLELKADPLLPVSVRNIEKQMSLQQVGVEGRSFNLSSQAKLAEIIGWYRKVMDKDDYGSARNVPLLGENQGNKFQMPKPSGEREFELVGIPLKKPGFYVVEMNSPRLGAALTEGGPMYVATSVLVTDMAVHLKKGRESSAVWVTHLSTGSPVDRALISVVDANGKELSKGTTDAQGVLRLGSIQEPCSSGQDNENLGTCEIFVFAHKGEDFSFTSSSWQKGIESYRFNISTEYLAREWGPVVLHTVLDRMAAQPGEVIQMKHILREHRQNGFAMLNEKSLPKQVFVVHQGSNKTYSLPFEFDRSSGTAIGKFTIPKDATLGRYAIYLSQKEVAPKKDSEESEDAFDWSAQETGHFIVSEYRLPMMKSAVKIQGEPLVRSSEVKADLSASYLSGGPAKNLKVKIRTSIQPGGFTPDVPGGADYSFFANPVKTGVVDSEIRQARDESFLKVQDVTLGADGGSLTLIKGLPVKNRLQEVLIEMEYLDPNGEVKTTSTQAPIFPGNLIVGLRSESWYTEPGKVSAAGVITGINGKPQANRAYTVEAFKTNYITHRKRLVGGFYSYDSKYEVTALGKVCDGVSDGLGRFQCQPKKLPPGSITLQAKTLDEKARPTYANAEVSVYEAGSESWWVPSDSDRIDLLPEKNHFEPGEKAKFVVQSPYPTAMALVTVEREGILDSFVTQIRRDNPVIEIPMKGNYAPNVFVSAIVVRGRVADPRPTALLDLARPAMKMGLTEIKVGWKAHELLVNVKANKNRYVTREKVQATIQVKTATGGNLPPNSEVAIAVVDESLLRLKDNTSWKILREMMGQRSLAVSTSSGQNQVIGRRHFGSKAKAPGGSGGILTADNARELFEPVLFWQPRVKLDSSGTAKVTFALNDSLTSFRIVAIATGAENYFGDGSTNIESSKDLILYSGFSPLVRDGDVIRNQLTLRNTTAKVMNVQLVVSSKEITKLPALAAVELKPSEAKTIEIPLTIPAGLKNISIQVQAKDQAGGATDSVVSQMRVEPAVPSRVLQATLFQLDRSHQIPVRQPSDAINGSGGLDLNVRSSLTAGLSGVRSYMSDYPYSCLEQQVSKAVVLEDKNELKKILETMPSYLDGDGLLKFFPTSMCGSSQLNRYVMGILQENGLEIPTATKERLIAGLTSILQGKINCQNWWEQTRSNPYSGQEKILLMEALSRFQSFEPGWLSTIQITPNLWQNETLIAWVNLLKRQSDVPNRDEQLKQAQTILRARVNFQGSTMNLQNEGSWESHWRLFTSQDQEAIGVLGIAIEDPSWEQDAGRVARALMARIRQGRWDTTTANAWGATKLRHFSEKFEKEKITGETKIAANGVGGTFDWKNFPTGTTLSVKWPTESDKKEIPVQFTQSGTGKPWIMIQTVSAIRLKSALDMGYSISRKVTPVVQAQAGTWQVGDVANVELTVTAKADQPWVVVRDPLPAGASHLGTGLQGSSALLDRAPTRPQPGNAVQEWPTEYDEKSHAHFTAYAAYLPRGTYRLNYRIRLNAAGDMQLPPSRVEALYAPETFGEAPNAVWKIAK